MTNLRILELDTTASVSHELTELDQELEAMISGGHSTCEPVAPKGDRPSPIWDENRVIRPPIQVI